MLFHNNFIGHYWQLSKNNTYVIYNLILKAMYFNNKFKKAFL